MSSDCGCGSAELQVGLVPFDEAMDKLLSFADPITESEVVTLTQGLNRVLAKKITSAIDVPPAANSAMDGYAIRFNDINPTGQTRLKISQRITAGETGEPLVPGTAARIFTGAPVPDDSDTVIMQEQVTVDGDFMSFDADVTFHQNVRDAGEDISQGQVILEKGVQIRAQEMGLAASIGEAELNVTRKIRVGIFFTGDELVDPGKPLSPGKIYDSNRYTLTGLLQSMGCEIVDLGIVGDTLQQTRDAIQKASQHTDLVITSGGVSVGEEDHVRIALEELGELHMWKLKIKPGKPLAFGKVNDTAFMGLPGNPVSAFATFCLFVSPLIKKLQGRKNVLPTRILVNAQFEWPKPDKRREFLRAKLITNSEGEQTTDIYSHQGSGVLMSTSWADGFIDLAEGQAVKQGDSVRYFSFADILG